MTAQDCSIVIPAFNEEAAIAQTIRGLREQYPAAEIIVVNDGSKDQTAALAAQEDCILINHRTNRGYGASWKTGVKNASRDLVCFFDGDGQFDFEDVGRVINHLHEKDADMVSGSRTKDSHAAVSRKPGKIVLHALANYLAQRKLPDPNCGLRVFRREDLENYLGLLPDGFSASLTSLLLYHRRGHLVEFLPITVKEREGTSSVRQFRDGFNIILLMLRLISLFDPLRIYLPVSLTLVALSIIYSSIKIFSDGLGVPVLGAVVFIGGMLCFFLGIIGDQISALRLERHAAPVKKAQHPAGDKSIQTLQVVNATQESQSR